MRYITADLTHSLPFILSHKKQHRATAAFGVYFLFTMFTKFSHPIKEKPVRYCRCGTSGAGSSKLHTLQLLMQVDWDPPALGAVDVGVHHTIFSHPIKQN